MAAFTIQTASGGLVEFDVNKSMITGTSLYLHVDQSFNIKSGEGDAAILLTVSECKDMIAAINEFIKFVEGRDYVYTSESVVELIAKPAVQEVLKDLDVDGDGVEMEEVIKKHE